MKVKPEKGKVYFIGAGPGDPDLLTVAAVRILQQADCVVYAGSLVHPDVIAIAPPASQRIDSASLTLKRITDIMIRAARSGKIVARVHSGDPSLFGAVAEQIKILESHNIPYKIIPGVSSVFAAAAALGIEYTVPEGTQTLILTRKTGRTPVPERESLTALAAHRSSMAIFLSADRIGAVVEDLIRGGYPPTTPAAVVYRATWPDQQQFLGTLADITRKFSGAGITRQALILVGEALSRPNACSRLYSSNFWHGFRRKSVAMPTKIAVITVTTQGVLTGTRILKTLDKAILYVPTCDVLHHRTKRMVRYHDLQATIHEVFRTYRAIALIMATGIAVRILGPLLSSKWKDPAVVVIDDCGQNVISLLSGHWGGANELAIALADVLGGRPVITTASDIMGLPSVDHMVKKLTGGRVPEDPGMIKKVQTAINQGNDVGFYPSELRFFPGMNCPWFHFYDSIHEASASPCKAIVVVSPFLELPRRRNNNVLHVVPRNIFIGIGCHAGVTVSEIQKAVQQACSLLQIQESSIAAICTVERRRREQGLIEFCRTKDIDLRTFSVQKIQKIRGPSPTSSHAMQALGVTGVAEPCALLGSQGGELLLKKRTVGNITIAIAQKHLHDIITANGVTYGETKG